MIAKTIAKIFTLLLLPPADYSKLPTGICLLCDTRAYCSLSRGLPFVSMLFGNISRGGGPFLFLFAWEMNVCCVF